MGDWLRLRTPGGAGAKPAAQFAELGRIGARVVRAEATGRKALAAIVADPAWRAGLPAAGGAGAAAPGFTLQGALRTGSAGSPVPSHPRGQVRELGSKTRFEALWRIAENSGAARIIAGGNADTSRVCRSLLQRSRNSHSFMSTRVSAARHVIPRG